MILRIGGIFPGLAGRAKQITFIRSFVPSKRFGEHEQAAIYVLTAGSRLPGELNKGFPLSTLWGRLAGAKHAVFGKPSQIAVSSESNASMHYKFCVEAQHPGALGPGATPFLLEPVLHPARGTNPAATLNTPQNRSSM